MTFKLECPIQFKLRFTPLRTERLTYLHVGSAVTRNYSAGMVSEHCHRVAQFMKDLIMTRDYYGRYEGCINDKGEGLSYY